MAPGELEWFVYHRLTGSLTRDDVRAALSESWALTVERYVATARQQNGDERRERWLAQQIPEIDLGTIPEGDWIPFEALCPRN